MINRQDLSKAKKHRLQKQHQQSKARVILFNKPYGVLCQFSPDGCNKTLSDYINAPGFYAAGRLDKDSEGLLVLTNDGRLQHEISHPQKKHEKTYLVQVEGDITDDALQQLEAGIVLKDGLTKPAKAQKQTTPAWVWQRTPPIRERKSIPTSWLKLQIREGKNRQVRRMTAAAGFPTLRLIRYALGSWTLNSIQPGEWYFSGARMRD